MLDGGDTFDYQDEQITAVIGLNPHFLLYTDGECRKQGASATGYVIYGVLSGRGSCRKYYTLALGGERIVGDFSSFVLEARALERGLRKLLCILSS